jgi:aryl-alcohol dehydrogenase-like predicted oxidoreductase
METRNLPRSGREISVLGLGTWAFGGRWSAGLGSADDRSSLATIRRAVDLGITWIDTAPVYGYGHAETVVGRALRALNASDRPLVFTKCGILWNERGEVRQEANPASIRAEVEASLKRLQVDVIDVLQIHWPSEDGTPVEETWTTMAELVEEGKVRALGVSNFDTALLERCASVCPIDAVQPPLNLIERQALADVVPWCREHLAGVVAYSPMAVGLLAGRFDREAIRRLPEDDFRREHEQFRDPALEANLKLVGRLRAIAESRGCTLAELAVSWVVSCTGVTAAIIGARRPDQLAPWSSPLPRLDDESLRAIEAAVVASGAGQGPFTGNGAPRLHPAKRKDRGGS